MPNLLSLHAFREQIRFLVADGKLSGPDADALLQNRQLGEEHQKVLRQELRPEHFGSPDEARVILARFGLQPEEIEAPRDPAGLGDKLKGKLLELGKKEVYKPYDLELAELKGEHAGVQLKVKAQIIAANDPLISDDKNRRATTERAMGAGDQLTWALTGGGLYPRVGFGTSIPIGAAHVSAGFSTSASIGYSVLAPYHREAEAALDLAKNLTVDLPFSAKKAKKLEEGSEVLLRGTGQLAVNAGVGVGQTLADFGGVVKVGASFGIDVGLSKSMDLAIRVKRLDKNQVYVSISALGANAANVNVGAHVGVDLNIRDQLPDLGGGVFEKAGDLATKEIEKQVEKWLQADFRASHSWGKSEREVTNYVFNLDDAEAAKAYEALMKLDTRAADKLVEDGGFAVRRAKLTETTRSDDSALSARFGPISLLSAISRTAEIHGLLETSQGNVGYHRARLEDGYSGIISNHWEGKRNVMRELISVEKNGAPAEYHYHLRHAITGDGVTSKNDIRRFLVLAEALGALGPEQQKLKGDDKFLKSFDDTDRIVDVFFTHAGLNKIAAATPEQISQIHSAAYEKIDEPWNMHYLFGNDRTWRETPWLAVNSPKYRDVMDLLQRGPEVQNAGGRGQGNTRNDRYRVLTGRDLGHDHAAWTEQKQLLQLVARMNATQDPAERIHILAKADKELGLEYARTLMCLAQIAGPEETLVADMTIRDKNKNSDVIFAREGAIQDPRVEIEARLAAVA